MGERTGTVSRKINLLNLAMMKRGLYYAVSALVVAGGLFYALHRANAQSEMSRPTGQGEIHFQTKLGSFKIIAVDKEPVTGTLTMNFSGSLLISGATTPPVIKGNVIQEYNNKEFNKVGYHGTGSVSVTGPLRSIEWFGSDMDGVFKGRAQVRLYGDFDKNLQTGTYWLTDPKQIINWSANAVLTIYIPAYNSGGYSSDSTPQSRQQFDNGKK